MSTITTRSGKGSPLTNSEVDTNFTNLNTDKLEDITSESIKDLSDVNSSMTPTDGQALLYDTTNGWQAESIITDVVGDTTPQLGGALDVNGNSIVSVSNGDINLTPDGTGTVNLNKTVDVAYGNVSFPGTQLDYSATASGLFDSTAQTSLDIYTNNRGYLVGGAGGNTGYVVQDPKYVSSLSVDSNGISCRLYGTAVSQGSNMTWTTSPLIGYADIRFNWTGTSAISVTGLVNTYNASIITGTVYNLSHASQAAALEAAIVSAAETAGVSSNLYDWIPDEVTVTESSDTFRARLAGSSTDLDTYSFTQNSSSVYIYNHYVLAGRFLILTQYPNHNDSNFANQNASANPATGITVARFDRTVQTQATPFGIVTTTNGNINLDPNGSGKVIFKGNSTKGSGQFILNCENNSHGITVKGPPHSAGASYTLTLPDDDGNSGQALTTDGSGNLSWTTPAGSYTHPNHSGEVTSTGDGATVIADDVVDEANLKVSNTPTDGYVLTARSGNTGGMTWEAASGGIALTDLSVTQNTASGSGTLTYDNTSGVFSYTPPASTGGGTSLSDPIKQTEFTNTATNTFSVTYTPNNINVFLNGSKLAADDFQASNGTSVVLNSACAASDVVTVVEYGAPFASQYSSSIFTVGTSSEYNTTSKVLTTPYTANKVAVYLNGVKLLVGTDCTATNGTTIDLTNSAPVTGDKIEVVEHGTLAEGVTTGKAIAMAIVFGG